MTQSLEDWKKKARKFTCGAIDDREGTLTYSINSKDLDTLIEQVWNARTEEILSMVPEELELEKGTYWHPREFIKDAITTPKISKEPTEEEKEIIRNY